ncbi:MAG: tetratricopeptide repeat protein [Methylococcaceae bacterium]|nr:tetratricopeptide repeat protein [Methylococcaceae bacterium]
MKPVVPSLKVVFLIVTIGLLTACGGSSERKAKYMEEGKQLMEKGDYEKAQLSFKNVLQIDPKDPEPRYQLAEALSKMGEIKEAVSQYLAVIGEDPKHIMSRLRMGQIYLLVKKPEEADKMAKEVQAIDPDNMEGIVLSAGIKAFNKDIQGALAQIQSGLQKHPDDLPANLLLTSLTAQSGKMEEAIAIAQKNSEKNPTSTVPLLMLSKLYMDTKANDKVQQTLEAIIKLQPKQLENHKRLATFFMANNQLDNAESVLREAVKQIPDDISAKTALIGFLVAKRSPEKAIADLAPMIEQNPDKYELRFVLADLEISQKHGDKAEEVLKKVVELDKLGPQSIKARNKLARIYVATKRLDEAKALIKTIIEENPRDVDALTLRGEFAMTESKINDAIGDFRAVLVDQPKNVRVLRLLSTAHMLNKDKVLARENMEKIIEIVPEDESARLELANLLQQTGDIDRAAEQINAVLKLNPKNRQALEGDFRIALSKKQWEKAQDAANRLQEAIPDEGMGFYLSGLAYQVEGELSKSVTAFENALAKQPDSVEPLTQLIKSYLAQKQTDKAVAKLNEAIKQQPKNPIAQNLLGGVYLGDKQYAEAMIAFKKANAIKPDWAVPYRMIALTYGAQNKLPEAIKTYQEGIVKTKGSKDLVNDLVGIYNKTGEHDKAIAVYEDIHKQYPESMEAVNNLASYLSDYAKDKEGLERAAKLAEPLIQINNPNMLDTVAWVAYKQGNYKKAQDLFIKALALEPESAPIQFHLGMTYFKQNDAAKARELLQKSVDKNVDFFGLDEAKETLKGLGGNVAPPAAKS